METIENIITGNIITQVQANKIKSIIHRSEAVKKVDFENSEIIMQAYLCK